MLRLLSIRDFVVVRSLELELEPGFTVLTGETGAGKSILLDALGLLLGALVGLAIVVSGATPALDFAEAQDDYVSLRSAGKSYAAAVEGRWAMGTPVPARIGGLTVQNAAAVEQVDGQMSPWMTIRSSLRDAARSSVCLPPQQ